MNQKSFIFIGRSGCGKGTQAELLSDYLEKVDPKREVLYVQTGAEFRDFVKGSSVTAQLSKKIMDVGGLQPEFLAIHMWIKVLVEKFTGKENLIFDGTSRKYHEAGAMDSIFTFYGLPKAYLIHLKISKEESIKRLLLRGRKDDNKKDIEERLSWYESEVERAIGFYRNNKDYNFLEIDGERTVEEIHKDIVSRI